MQKACRSKLHVLGEVIMSAQYLTLTFQSFANGIKVSYRNAASEIYSELAMKSVFLCTC